MGADSSHTPALFFVEPGMVAGDEVILTGDLFRHALAKRLKPGEAFRAVSGGSIHDAIVMAVGSHKVVGRIVATSPAANPPADIHLFAALLKGPKFDFVIEKVTELGVRSIHPMVTARTVARPDGEKASVRRERWARIAKASCEQSGRSFIPPVADLVSFDAILSRSEEPVTGKRLLAHEHPVSRPGMAEPDRVGRQTISVFIGPEGGFDSSEVDRALDAGFIPFSLGPYILKADTASIAAVAILVCSHAPSGRT